MLKLAYLETRVNPISRKFAAMVTYDGLLRTFPMAIEPVSDGSA